MLMDRASVDIMLCLALSLLLMLPHLCSGGLNKTTCPDDCTKILCASHIVYHAEGGVEKKYTRLKYLKKFCTNGIVYGPCDCCQVCGKGLGEDCAAYNGQQAWRGKCGDGLYCHELSQKCTQKVVVSQEPNPRNADRRCKPRCTYKYCKIQKNPAATICSAVKNRVVKQSCQGGCQHTSCAACFHKVHKHPKLMRCSHDDFQCMRQFAKSFKSFYCNKHKYPCKPNSMTKAFRKKFVCHVPRCSK